MGCGTGPLFLTLQVFPPHLHCSPSRILIPTFPSKFLLEWCLPRVTVFNIFEAVTPLVPSTYICMSLCALPLLPLFSFIHNHAAGPCLYHPLLLFPIFSLSDTNLRSLAGHLYTLFFPHQDQFPLSFSTNFPTLPHIFLPLLVSPSAPYIILSFPATAAALIHASEFRQVRDTWITLNKHLTCSNTRQPRRTVPPTCNKECYVRREVVTNLILNNVQ